MGVNGCFLPTSCVLRQKGTLSLRALLPPIFSSHKCFTRTCCTVESARVFKYSWKHLEDCRGGKFNTNKRKWRRWRKESGELERWLKGSASQHLKKLGNKGQENVLETHVQHFPVKPLRTLMHFAMLVTSVMVVLDYLYFLRVKRVESPETIRCTYTDTDSAQCTAEEASTKAGIHLLHIDL